MLVLIFVLAFFVGHSYQLNNGLGRTPPMGKDENNSFNYNATNLIKIMYCNVLTILYE